MIERLIEDDAKAVRNNGHWLETLMRVGFPGYDNMSDEELLAELGKRMLAEEPKGQG
jgi:hypothetical protein